MGQSDLFILHDDSWNHQLLARGTTNHIHVTLPQSLGELEHVHIWHDNSGNDPSWFLDYIMITDEKNNRVKYFICDDWLAVDMSDGLIQRTVAATPEEQVYRS